MVIVIKTESFANHSEDKGIHWLFATECRCSCSGARDAACVLTLHLAEGRSQHALKSVSAPQAEDRYVREDKA